MRPIRILFILLTFSGCVTQEKDFFLSADFVNLRGKESLTIIENATSDTLRLAGTFFNAMPYVENPFTVKIAPRQKDTLKFNFTFPDFIYFDEPYYFRLFNAPGKILECKVLSLTEKTAQIAFVGELSDINEFYLAYHNEMGSDLENNRPYYQAADRIEDFNTFPSIADSIDQLSLDFVKSYGRPVPGWFKKHEEWRQKYLVAFMKDNVRRSKEFYGGKKVEVSKDYYSYEKELPIENAEMILNGDYLWYLRAYVHNQASKVNNPDSASAFFMAEILFGRSVVGDIFKMDKLSGLYYTGRKEDYDSLLNATVFRDSIKKQIVDSLISVKYGLPRIGEPVPDLLLTDVSGEKVSLRNYKGNFVIVNFWATWCGPCIAEFSGENKLYLENKAKGLTVINICVDSEISQWKAVSEKHDLQMINLYADKDEYQRISRVFGISGLPKSLLLNKNSTVVKNNFKRASALTAQDIRQIVN